MQIDEYLYSHSGPNTGIIRQITGAPNDGFLLNTLESFVRLSRVPLRSLEMHSKGRYKICTCSVILGELESSELQGLQYYFPENFRCSLTSYESQNFSDSSLHHIFVSENFRFPFCTKNSPTWAVKCKELNFRKSQGNNYISFKNCT